MKHVKCLRMAPASSFAALHVGRDGSSGRQALEALVGVVDEDPVLVLVV